MEMQVRVFMASLNVRLVTVGVPVHEVYVNMYTNYRYTVVSLLIFMIKNASGWIAKVKFTTTTNNIHGRVPFSFTLSIHNTTIICT